MILFFTVLSEGEADNTAHAHNSFAECHTQLPCVIINRSICCDSPHSLLGAEDDVRPRVRLDDARHLANFNGLRAILELLLHVTWPKLTQVAASREGSAVAALLGILRKDCLRATRRVDLLNECLHLCMRLLFGGARRGCVSASGHWVARALVLDEQVPALHFARHDSEASRPRRSKVGCKALRA